MTNDYLIMNRYSSLTALLFLMILSFCALQEASAQKDVPGARKYDEFSDLPSSDIAARLDGLAQELQAQPNVKAFIITYRSRRDLPGLSGRLMIRMRDYLINSRGIDPARVVGIDGGAADCLTQELWIVPVGATPTPRKDAYQTGFEDTDSARKYDEEGIEEEASYYTSIYQSLEGFANALKREPRSSAYLIAYAQYWVSRWEDTDERGVKRSRVSVQRDPPEAARKSLAVAKEQLVNKYKIPPSRIKLIDGGYRKWAEMELWIVPRGEHAPIPTPNAFPKGRNGTTRTKRRAGR